MIFDPEKVDIGNIVKCDKCQKLTYYPFDKPWYKKRRLLMGYIISIIINQLKDGLIIMKLLSKRQFDLQS